MAGLLECVIELKESGDDGKVRSPLSPLVPLWERDQG